MNSNLHDTCLHLHLAVCMYYRKFASIKGETASKYSYVNTHVYVSVCVHAYNLM